MISTSDGILLYTFLPVAIPSFIFFAYLPFIKNKAPLWKYNCVLVGVFYIDLVKAYHLDAPATAMLMMLGAFLNTLLLLFSIILWLFLFRKFTIEKRYFLVLALVSLTGIIHPVAVVI